MRSTIPSLQSLVAFEKVAHLRSFTRAADQLRMTQGAVSKQVGSLETFLGVKLFSRTRAGLVLTKKGEEYLADIKPHIEGLAEAGANVMRPAGTVTPLRIRGLATLNDRWLLPRLSRFMEKHPKTRVEFTTVLMAASHYVSTAELEIRFGSGDWLDVESQYLIGAECTVVVSRSFLTRHCNLASILPGHVLDWPRCEHRQAPFLWQEFMITHGLADRKLPQAAEVHEVFSVLISTAVNGLAAGLVPRFLVENELSSGLLINPAGLETKSTSGYYVCWPRKTPLRSEARTFVEWLLKEAQIVTSTSDSSHPSASHPAD